MKTRFSTTFHFEGFPLVDTLGHVRWINIEIICTDIHWQHCAEVDFPFALSQSSLRSVRDVQALLASGNTTQIGVYKTKKKKKKSNRNNFKKKLFCGKGL